MSTRIYLITDVADIHLARLVRAANRAQALRHVAADRLAEPA